MSKRIFKKLGIADLPILINTKKDADALEIWQIDEENARLFLSNPMNCFLHVLKIIRSLVMYVDMSLIAWIKRAICSIYTEWVFTQTIVGSV